MAISTMRIRAISVRVGRVLGGPVAPPERTAPRRVRAHRGSARRWRGGRSEWGRRCRPRMPQRWLVTGASPRAPRRPTRAPLAPMRTLSPGTTPALTSSRSTPSRARSRWKRSADSALSKFVCAASRSMRRPTTRYAPSSLADREDVRAGLEAMHDDTRRLARLAQCRGVGQQARKALISLSIPWPCCAEMARTRASPSRAAWRRPSRLRGLGQIDLVADDQADLLEQRGVVRLELVADDLVVALRIALTRDRRRGLARALRATWRRNAWPRPAPPLAPSIRPGMSAIVTRRSSAGSDAPRSSTPRFGSRVVNG